MSEHDPRLELPSEPDDCQRQAIAAGLAGGAVVLGAPGSGKSATALLTTARHLQLGLSPLLLAPSRSVAAHLRTRLTLHQGTVAGPVVRTAVSLAFAILTDYHRALGQAGPVLITGSEQNAIIEDLLAGQLRGEAPVPWPAHIPPEALALPAFRDELRDAFARCAEFGVDPELLAGWAEQLNRPQWASVAAELRRYGEVLGQQEHGSADARPRYDAAEAIDAAAAIVADGGRDALAQWWDAVIVDDAQDATAGTWRLLRALADAGARLILIGDPDVSAQAFRGAQPRMLTRAAEPSGTWPGLPIITLAGSYRLGGDVARALARVVDVIRPAGSGAHRLVPGEAGPASRAQVVICPSAAAQVREVATWLRHCHLIEEVPWGELAVIARSSAGVHELRDGLTLLGVPVTVPGAQVPLAHEPAVRPLLQALTVLTSGEPPTASQAEELALSPLGQADALAIRRLRRALRESEKAAGGTRASDELLAEAIWRPGALDAIDDEAAAPARRIAMILAAGRLALAAEGAAGHDVLHAMWESSGLEERWLALSGQAGATGQRADRDLDAVVALFRLAEVFAERNPQAGAAAFAGLLAVQDLPGDRIAAASPAGQSVTLTTATGAVGREWRRVAIVSVQDGAWPDLRLRDTLLGAPLIADLAQDRWPGGEVDQAAARRDVLDDELRVFALAISRASEQVLATAVLSQDERPSEFLALVEPGAHLEEVSRVPARLPLDLRSLVAEARRRLEAAHVAEGERGPGPASAAQAADAARALALLAEAGVPGADPGSWYGLTLPGPSRPAFPEGIAVPLTPSRVEQLLTCPLRWLLEGAGGHDGTSHAQSLGTLIHEIAELAPGGSLPVMLAHFERLWPRLGLGDGWLERREQREARRMVERLSRYLGRAPGALMTEGSFALALPGALLRGRVDRVEDGPAGPVIVDFKTSKNPIPLADAATNPQLAMYQLAAAEGALTGLTAPPGGARLVYLGNTSFTGNEAIREQPPMGPEARLAAREQLAAAASEASGTQFTAKENDTCGTCPVRRSCPVQHEGRQVLS